MAVLLASAAYGIMPVFSRLAMETGLTAQSVVFYRFLFSFLCSGILLLLTGTSVKAEKKQVGAMFFFGILGFGLTILLLTQSYRYIPIGMATMLHFSYPLLVAAVMAIFFGEPFGRRKQAACLCSAVGLLCTADLTLSGKGGMGMLLAVLSGFTYAVFVIAGRKACYHTLPPLTVTFYCSMSASLVFGVKTVLTGGMQRPTGALAWGCLLMISVVSTVSALCLLTVGIRILGAAKASVLNMAEPVIGVAAGALVFGEPLTWSAVCGGILVVISAILFVKEN